MYVYMYVCYFLVDFCRKFPRHPQVLLRLHRRPQALLRLHRRAVSRQPPNPLPASSQRDGFGVAGLMQRILGESFCNGWGSWGCPEECPGGVLGLSWGACPRTSPRHPQSVLGVSWGHPGVSCPRTSPWSFWVESEGGILGMWLEFQWNSCEFC